MSGLIDTLERADAAHKHDAVYIRSLELLCRVFLGYTTAELARLRIAVIQMAEAPDIGCPCCIVQGSPCTAHKGAAS